METSDASGVDTVFAHTIWTFCAYKGDLIRDLFKVEAFPMWEF